MADGRPWLKSAVRPSWWRVQFSGWPTVIFEKILECGETLLSVPQPKELLRLRAAIPVGLFRE